MNVTLTHATFYTARKGPQWCRRILGKAGIDECINAHAKRKTREFEMNAGNLCAIVRSMRRRGADLRWELTRIAAMPGTIINPAQRARYARRWAARIARREDA